MTRVVLMGDPLLVVVMFNFQTPWQPQYHDPFEGLWMKAHSYQQPLNVELHAHDVT